MSNFSQSFNGLPELPIFEISGSSSRQIPALKYFSKLFAKPMRTQSATTISASCKKLTPSLILLYTSMINSFYLFFLYKYYYKSLRTSWRTVRITSEHSEILGLKVQTESHIFLRRFKHFRAEFMGVILSSVGAPLIVFHHCIWGMSHTLPFWILLLCIPLGCIEYSIQFLYIYI